MHEGSKTAVVAAACVAAVGLWAGMLVWSPGAAEAGERADTVITSMSGEHLYLQFVDQPAPPNTIYHVRGKLSVKVYEEWVHVSFADEPKQYVIPRDRVIYLGTEEIR